MLEDNKQRLGIADYLLTQTTLEQVFLRFARMQNQTDAPSGDGAGEGNGDGAYEGGKQSGAEGEGEGEVSNKKGSRKESLGGDGAQGNVPGDAEGIEV